MKIDMDKVKEFLTFRRRGEEAKPKEPELMKGSTGKYEVNLLPEVKLEMIRTQKVRNLVLFGTIVVASVSVGIVAILGAVKGGQDIALTSQDNQLKSLSAKITSDTQLRDILTIQKQLNKISEIEGNKKVLSRVFSLLSVLLPTGEDEIKISELNVDLDSTTLNFEAQADAGVEPLIDYRVLESFKKSVALMKFDYGRYVTSKDTDIPTYCIVETNSDDVTFADEKTGGIYAEWHRNMSDCVPDGKDNLDATERAKFDKRLEQLSSENEEKTEDEQKTSDELETEVLTEMLPELSTKIIWRTPLFKEWYKDNKMDLSGTISDVEHFKSECISYSGVEDDDGKVTWSADNNCDLAPEGIEVSDSANGRDSSGALVLRFSGTTTINDEFFAYNNKHVMGISPFGQNVTDSYVQTENIFVAPARDCEYGDTDCLNNTQNITGE